MSIRNKKKIIEFIEDKGLPIWFVVLMAVVSGLSISNIYYIQPLLEDVRLELNLSANLANQITVVSQIGYVLGLFILIPLADKVSRRNLLKITFTMLVISLVIMYISSSFYLILTANIFIGFCAVIPHIFIPIAAQYSTPKDKSRNVGYILSGLLSGIIASRVISGFIGSIWGWRVIFIFASAIMALSAIVVLYFTPDTKPNFTGKYTSLLKTIWTLFKKHPLARVCSLRAALGMGSLYAMWACLAFHIASPPFNAGSRQVSLLSLCAIAGVITASNIGGLINKYGSRKLGYISISIHIISWVILYFFGFTYIGMILGIILIDMGQQAMQLSQQTKVLSLEPSATNRMNTIFMTIFFTFGSIGTFLSGFGWTYLGWTGVSIVGMILAVLSMVVSLYSQFIAKYPE